MRTLALAAALLLASLSRSATAEEAPPAPPAPSVPTKPAKKPPAPEWPGVRWEGDVEAGLSRAAKEGRPVLVVVNALEEEGATKMLAESAYPTKPWGDATRPYVCFVGNGNTHAQVDGSEGSEGAEGSGAAACARFRTLPCPGHQDVLSWILRRFSADGESITSPTHILLEPDGGVAYRKEFYTQDESPPFLDTWAAWIAPRLAAKRAWIVREARLDALTKASTQTLADDARAWIATGDAYAAPGLVALLDLESKPERRVAIRAALATAPQTSWPSLFDEVEAATQDPDADLDAALAWTQAALLVDRDLGAWAYLRVAARTRDAKAAALALGFLEKDPRGVEALLLRRSAATPSAQAKPAAGENARIRRARLLSGDPHAPAIPPLDGLSRAETAAALLLMPKAVVEERADEVKAARGSRHADVRVAAAVALLRTGDESGVRAILDALADPIEGPEVHGALVHGYGQDPGADPAAWEGVLRGPSKEPGK